MMIILLFILNFYLNTQNCKCSNVLNINLNSTRHNDCNKKIDHQNLSSLVDFIQTDESKLRYSILKNYDINSRPVLNISTPNLVNVSLSNVQIINLVIII